jgi:integrase
MQNEEIRQFLNQAKDSKFYLAYLLALTTGMRRGEILALRWQDVDLNNNQVSVNQSLVRVKEGGLIFQEPKTKLAKRTINISNHLSTLLQEHQEIQEEIRKSEGINYRSDLDLIFCNNLGEPICPRNITRQFERLLINAGMDRMPFHSLRHTYSTICLQEKVDIKTIQETLGHHSSAFTMDVYSSVTDRMKRDASDKIDSLISSLLE